MRAVLKLDTALGSHLVQAKDAVDPTKENSVAYSIDCSLTMRLLKRYISC